MLHPRKEDRRNYVKYAGAGVAVGAASGAYYAFKSQMPSTPSPNTTKINNTFHDKVFLLPLPKFTSGVLVEEAIAWRRSIREYKNEPIKIVHLSKILWASQGINEFGYGFRTVPSAGATYPLKVYSIIANDGVTINGANYLPAGLYVYNIKNHSIKLIKSGDFREELTQAALHQEWVRKAPVNIVINSVYERTTGRYGDRGYRYVHMEDGHAGENIYLMVAALGLGTVAIGAFDDEKVGKIIGAEQKEHPLYIMPIAIPKEPYEIKEEELSNYYRRVRES
jgi:SagB-type dehydrogenase family enzyme